MSAATLPNAPEISILVPVYRNKDTLCDLYRRLRDVLDMHSLTFEMLFVDDACPEGSLAVLEELVQHDPRVAVLVLKRNMGQQRAVLVGLKHVRGESVVVMDADLQDPAEAIPWLLSKMQEGPAAVFGGRRGQYESPFRLLTSRLFKKLLHLLGGVPEDAGLFVAMNRQMVERLLAFGEPKPFVLALIGCTGLPLASIPVVRAQRPIGHSAYTFWNRLKIGCLAIAWVFAWKCFRGRRIPTRGDGEDPVRVYIGRRFAPSRVGAALREGGVRQLAQRELEEHNRQQRAYFEATVKPTLVPADSSYIRRHVDELFRFGNIEPRDRALEIGCGMGRYTLNIAQRGVTVEGLDLSPVLLDRLRHFDGGRYNIPLYCTDVLHSPPELAGRFDAVVGFFTLHHLHNLSKCFAAIARLLKPGGRVLFLEPNPYNPLYYIQMLITPGMTWQGDRGILRMRSSLIFPAMQSAGLSHLAMTRFGFFPPFLANQPWGARLEAALERVPIWRRLLPFQLFRGERL